MCFSEFPWFILQTEHFLKGIKMPLLRQECTDHEEACSTRHMFHKSHKLSLKQALIEFSANLLHLKYGENLFMVKLLFAAANPQWCISDDGDGANGFVIYLHNASSPSVCKVSHV